MEEKFNCYTDFLGGLEIKMIAKQERGFNQIIIIESIKNRVSKLPFVLSRLNIRTYIPSRLFKIAMKEKRDDLEQGCLTYVMVVGADLLISPCMLSEVMRSCKGGKDLIKQGKGKVWKSTPKMLNLMGPIYPFETWTYHDMAEPTSLHSMGHSCWSFHVKFVWPKQD